MTLKKLLRVLLPCIYLSAISFQQSAAQSSDSVNAFYAQALNNARQVYHKGFGDQSGLNNGRQYVEYPFKFKEGDPYYGSPNPEPGSVWYDGVQYDDVLMRYNEITDQLIVNYYADRVQLLQPKVGWFRFYRNDFIRIDKDSTSSNLVSSGFYNRLYNGKISLLKKEIKKIKETATINVELLIIVEQKDYYYLKKEGKYFLIDNKRDFFDFVADRKKEVKSFIKANNLNFRKDRQNTLTQSIAYYDSLKK